MTAKEDPCPLNPHQSFGSDCHAKVAVEHADSPSKSMAGAKTSRNPAPPQSTSTNESSKHQDNAPKSKEQNLSPLQEQSNNGSKTTKKSKTNAHNSILASPPGSGGKCGNPTPLTSSNNPSRAINKPCCFCWCCCCRCHCLTTKNGEDVGNRTNKNVSKSEALNNDNDHMPSLEEIRSWAESFDRLMKNQMGRKIFREFLKCEYSEENILFYLACEDLKKESNPEVVEEKARLIYEDYISILSPKEVSLDSRVREVINRNMMDPSPRTFDEAQVQIYTLMHRDSYPRFINSPLYKKIAQLNSTSRKESSA